MVYYRKDQKSWCASWQGVDEKQKRKVGFSSKQNALLYEMRQKVLVEKNFSRGTEYDQDITVDEVAEKYLQVVKYSTKESSYNEEKRTVAKVLEYFREEGLYFCRHLKKSDMQNFVVWRKENITPRGKSPSDVSVNKNISAIKRVFKYAFDNSLIPVNIFDRVKRIKVDKQNDPRILTLEELEIISDFAVGSVIEDEIFFLVRTGMRVSEMINLTIKDVDLEKRIIFVRAGNAKSRKTRHVPAVSAVAEQLESMIKKAKENKRNLLFVNSIGGKHDPSNILRRFKHVLGKAKKKGVDIERVNIHTLRRTYISHMIMNKQDPAKVMRIVGHESWETMKKYLYLTQEYLSDVPEIF